MDFSSLESAASNFSCANPYHSIATESYSHTLVHSGWYLLQPLLHQSHSFQHQSFLNQLVLEMACQSAESGSNFAKTLFEELDDMDASQGVILKSAWQKEVLWREQLSSVHHQNTTPGLLNQWILSPSGWAYTLAPTFVAGLWYMYLPAVNLLLRLTGAVGSSCHLGSPKHKTRLESILWCSFP